MPVATWDHLSSIYGQSSIFFTMMRAISIAVGWLYFKASLLKSLLPLDVYGTRGVIEATCREVEYDLADRLRYTELWRILTECERKQNHTAQYYVAVVQAWLSMFHGCWMPFKNFQALWSRARRLYTSRKAGIFLCIPVEKRRPIGGKAWRDRMCMGEGKKRVEQDGRGKNEDSMEHLGGSGADHWQWVHSRMDVGLLIRFE